MAKANHVGVNHEAFLTAEAALRCVRVGVERGGGPGDHEIPRVIK